MEPPEHCQPIKPVSERLAVNLETARAVAEQRSREPGGYLAVYWTLNAVILPVDGFEAELIVGVHIGNKGPLKVALWEPFKNHAVDEHSMSTDQPDETALLEERIGERLRARNDSLAVAESLTGGLVCSRLTSIPGASDYVDRGVVAYSNEAKQTVLGVSREALDSDGAVSETVAAEMARGVRDTAGTTWGLSTTGIAGPTGGTDQKPVGLVYIGVAYAGPWGTGSSMARVERYVFDGDRGAVVRQSTTHALRALDQALDVVESD